MRFLTKSKELENNPLLKSLMAFLLVTLILYLALDILLHHEQIGLTLSQATNTIMGNEEEFLEPILLDTILEHIHFDTLSSLLSLMMIAVILIRLKPKNQKQYCIHFAFMSAILSQVALIFSFYHQGFIAIWIGLFLTWHIVAVIMGINSLWKLFK